MLPPGHVAGGYLVAEILLKTLKPDLDISQTRAVLFFGIFFAFAPDMDFFYAFFKVKSLTIQDNKVNHRHFISHAPILWLIPGLLVYLTALNDFYRTIGLVIWLGSWSHFLLDSLQYGITWLWPFSKKIYAFADVGKIKPLNEPNFFKYWVKFIRSYTRNLTFTFVSEIIIIIIALIVYLK